LVGVERVAITLSKFGHITNGQRATVYISFYACADKEWGNIAAVHSCRRFNDGNLPLYVRIYNKCSFNITVDIGILLWGIISCDGSS